jgi:hypothetical protein
VGNFEVSTIVDDIGVYETRLFRVEALTFQGQDIPQIMKDAISATTWENVPGIKGRVFTGYDNESVESFERDDSLIIHGTFMRIVEDFHSGNLS